MENAHLRMGKLKFVRQTRDTITEVSLHMDRLVAEKPTEPRSAVQIHLVSVFGGDQEMGAIAAAIADEQRFQISLPGRGRVARVPWREARDVPGVTPDSWPETTGQASSCRFADALWDDTRSRRTSSANHSLRRRARICTTPPGGTVRSAGPSGLGRMVRGGAQTARIGGGASGVQLFTRSNQRHQAPDVAHLEHGYKTQAHRRAAADIGIRSTSGSCLGESSCLAFSLTCLSR